MVKKGELEKLLLPRLLSSATQVKVKKLKRILGYYNANFRCDALLLFLILLGEANFKCWQANQCTSNKAKVKLTILHRRSVVLALKAGRFSSVRSFLKHQSY